MDKNEAIKFLMQIHEAIGVVLATDAVHYQIRLIGIQTDRNANVVRVLRDAGKIDMSLGGVVETFIKPIRAGETVIVKTGLTSDEAVALASKLLEVGGSTVIEVQK